jgi:hypothetical protein
MSGTTLAGVLGVPFAVTSTSDIVRFVTGAPQQSHCLQQAYLAT